MARPELPDLDLEGFASQVEALSSRPLPVSTLAALHSHYQELRRWNATLSLIGPGTVGEVLERHYGESLAALPLVPRDCCEVVDVGSGAGFPGLVLAATLPEARVTLIEARQRKWAFLEAAARRAALSCRCLNARVGASLPADLDQRIDLVTARALKLPAALLASFGERLSPDGRMLFWVGEEAPEPPPGFERGAEVSLPGSSRRRIVELHRVAS
jgi:16S rRNA (guanine527-N7)-methyltransferase